MLVNGYKIRAAIKKLTRKRDVLQTKFVKSATYFASKGESPELETVGGDLDITETQLVALHAIESDYTILRPRVTYSVTDHVSAEVGYLFIAGRAESVGGQFRRNGQGWVELEYRM